MTGAYRVGLYAGALVVSAAVGYLPATGSWLLPPIGGLLLAAWLIVAAPTRAVVWLAGAGSLVAQARWPVVASAAGVDVYVGDALLILAAAAVLARPTRRPLCRALVALLLTLTAWAAFRSDMAGFLAFGRMVAPALLLLGVATILPAGYDLRRDLRWLPVATLVSVPLLDGLASSRWFSLAGGPNETALIAAVAVVLGFTLRGPWRYGLVAVGGLLLYGTAAITGTAAAVLGVLAYSFLPRTSRTRLGAGAPLVGAWLVLVAVAALPLLRSDISGTLNAHWFQVSRLNSVLRSGDPAFGVGWAQVDISAFGGSDVLGLHNVYLDMFAFLGLVGFVLFAALLVRVWRTGDVVTKALLITWCVWVNTSGAFPGTAWGVLGFILATAALSQLPGQQPLTDDELAQPRHASA